MDGRKAGTFCVRRSRNVKRSPASAISRNCWEARILRFPVFFFGVESSLISGVQLLQLVGSVVKLGLFVFLYFFCSGVAYDIR